MCWRRTIGSKFQVELPQRRYKDITREGPGVGREGDVEVIQSVNEAVPAGVVMSRPGGKAYHLALALTFPCTVKHAKNYTSRSFPSTLGLEVNETWGQVLAVGLKSGRAVCILVSIGSAMDDTVNYS